MQLSLRAVVLTELRRDNPKIASDYPVVWDCFAVYRDKNSTADHRQQHFKWTDCFQSMRLIGRHDDRVTGSQLEGCS